MGLMPFFWWSRVRTASTWRVLCYPWDEGKPGQRGSSAPTFREINPKSQRAEGRCWKMNKLPESSAKVCKASGRNKPSLGSWRCSITWILCLALGVRVDTLRLSIKSCRGVHSCLGQLRIRCKASDVNQLEAFTLAVCWAQQ